MEKKIVTISTSVGVKLRIDGIHCFPEAEPSVEYLIYPHRHTFYIEACVSVSHDNREIEFFTLKNQLRRYLVDEYWDPSIQCLDFGNLSCEMIARKLAEVFDLDYVKVSEDDNDYAEAFRTITTTKTEDCTKKEQPQVEKKAQIKKMIQIIGKLCSGKTYAANKLREDLTKKGYSVLSIEVGEIIRALTGKEQRVFDKTLANQAFEEIKKIVLAHTDVDFVIVIGCRQVSLCKKLEQEFSKKINDIQWKHIVYTLDIHDEIRKSRFLARKDAKDNGATFEQLDKQDARLGINDLINYLHKKTRM